VQPISLSRYSASILPAIRRWDFSPEFTAHLPEHGYPIPQFGPLVRAGPTLRELSDALTSQLRLARDRHPTGSWR
jgi:hypothetical protein